MLQNGNTILFLFRHGALFESFPEGEKGEDTPPIAGNFAEGCILASKLLKRK
jgi:hypothetical protein